MAMGGTQKGAFLRGPMEAPLVSIKPMHSALLLDRRECLLAGSDETTTIFTCSSRSQYWSHSGNIKGEERMMGANTRTMSRQSPGLILPGEEDEDFEFCILRAKLSEHLLPVPGSLLSTLIIWTHLTLEMFL